MRRHRRCLWKLLALVPLLGVYNFATCQADILRRTAEELDQAADDFDDDDDPELGEILSDVVEDW
jgi:hypothetical protein